MQTQCFHFTERRGFVFSVDAAVSVILFISALFLFSQSTPEIPSGFNHSLQIGEDALAAMQKTGFLNETLDTNTLNQSAVLLRQKILALIPGNLEARVELKNYALDINLCRNSQNYDSCFLQTPPITSFDGPLIPQKEVFSSKKLLILGSDPGACDLNAALIAQSQIVSNGIAYFSKNEEYALYLEEENPLQIDFNVSVDPSGTLACDQNLEVTLSVSVPKTVRPPIDMMLVLDRSGSMSWNGRIDTSDATGVWVSGNNAFIADGWRGVRSMDITTPFIPAQLDRYDPGTIIDVYGEGNFVFLADTRFTDELIAIDAENPSNLIEVDQLNFDFVRGLFVDSGYAYVAGERRNASDSGLVIVDVSDPANMVRLGNIDTADPRDVFVKGNYAYFADGTAGFKVIDVTNKNNPVLMDSVNTAGSARGIFVLENHAFVADGTNGLVIIDVTDPANIFITDTINTPDFAGNVFVDGNSAYVTDNSSLQRINVADKTNVFLERVFNTPYRYNDIFVQNNIGYIAADFIGLIELDLLNGERIANAKAAASSFIDFNGWALPPDQIGLSSFNSTATLNQILTSVKADVNNATYALISSGGTNIESGIDAANAELTGENANPGAIKFEVVLSDGQSTSGNSANAAQVAADSNITIFTIGFGADADAAELTAIATITGGNYYAAGDENALQAIFTIIASEIAERASDVNVSIPTLGGSMILDPGSGVVVDGNLVFEAGDLSGEEPWTAVYILNFPCSNSTNCNVDAITLPGFGAQLTYIDGSGLPHTVDFNAQTTMNFYKRDLSVFINSGTAVTNTEVYIDVLVQNVAELDANSIDMNFFVNDLNPPRAGSVKVPPLCSIQTPGCTQSAQSFSSVLIPSNGKIYATIGDGTEIRECPANNTSAVFCGSGTPAQYIEIKYFIWRK